MFRHSNINKKILFVHVVHIYKHSPITCFHADNHIYAYTHTRTHTHICIYIYIHICTYIYIYIYTYVLYIYIYVYIYIDIHIIHVYLFLFIYLRIRVLQTTKNPSNNRVKILTLLHSFQRCTLTLLEFFKC